MAKKKVLLMGKAHSGKTSMRSIIFANYLARDTTRLSPTLDVEHHHVRFLGDLVLNLWDCGGQDAFYESYFERDRDTIFRGVELLIYVFDIESDQPKKDFDHFCGVLEAIEENSPDARVFILVHKMDLVAPEDRDAIFEDRKEMIEDSCRSCGVEHFQCFGTSIWDETLYKAWSEIVTNLIPNIRLLETHLNKFCKMCDADEVVLFERATFLVISHASATTLPSPNDPDSILAPPPPPMELLEGGEMRGGGGAGGSDTPPVSSSPRPMIPGDYHHHEGPPETTLSGDFPPTEVGGGDVDSNNHHRGAATMLVDSIPRHVSRTPHFDAHRFEKISNIVKQFKLSCGKAQSQFQGMQVRNSRFSAFIDAFTANTYIMVIVSNPHVHTAATLLNIHNARNHFEKFIPRI